MPYLGHFIQKLVCLDCLRPTEGELHMFSTIQLSMSRFSIANMPRWLVITSLTLLVAAGGPLLLLFALHSPALLVDVWHIPETDALWIVTTLLNGGGWLIDIVFPELIPVIGVIWWFIDVVGNMAAVAY